MIYYTPDKLLEKARSLGCGTVFAVGGKGIGKTFGFIRYFLEQFLNDKGYLRYVRRYRDSIAPKAIMSLLEPQRQNIINLTKGKYNSYKYYQNRFWLTKVDKEGEVEHTMSKPFIICSAINAVESYTGADEGLCCGILFDEFLSRERCVSKEYESLMILHSNCWRNRGNEMPLVLIGNTFTRNSTLARDFGINLYQVPENSVTVFKGKKNKVIAVVERCADTVLLQTAANDYYDRYNDGRLNMITSNGWALPDYPRISKRYAEAGTVIFDALCVYEKNFSMKVITYKSYDFVYISDENSSLIDCTITTKTTPLHSDLINYFPNDVFIFKYIAKLIARGQIFFEHGDNGEMFRDFMLNLKGGEKIGGLFK